MSGNNSSQFMGTESIGKLLIKFSVPAIVGMLVNALYNVVDRIFVGQGVNTMALSGITIAFPIMNIIMAFSMLIGVGATALISIRLGEGKKSEAENIFGNTLTLNAIVSLSLTVLGLIFLEPILILFGGTGEVLDYAKEFMTIILLGNFFGNLAYSTNNIIRAEGKPKIAMNTMLIGAISNIILNPIFIFGFKFGVKGSATATVISQIISSIWVLNYFLSKKNNSLLKIKKENLKPKFKTVTDIFSIGASPFAMQIAASGITVILNKQLVDYGNDVSIAVMGVINSIVMLILMPIFGINQGSQPIVGYNYGSKQFNRVKKTLKLSIISATIVSTLGYIIIAIFPKFIMGMFADSSNPDIFNEFISQGVYALRVYLCMLPIVGFQVVSSNYFQSVGKAKYSIFLSLSRQVIILLPLLLILPKIFGFHGIFIAGPASDLLASLITGFFILREMKLLNNTIKIP